MGRTGTYQGPWDAEYSSKGRIWRRETEDIPPMDAGNVVLDLGCGDGKTLRAIRGDMRPVGLDISSTALALAGGVAPGALLVQGECTSLPFPDAAFDVILAFHILDHLLEADRGAAIGEAVRVLRRGGALHFRGFSRRDLRAGSGTPAGEEATFRRGDGGDVEGGLIYHYFDIDEVRGMFSVHGLRVLYVREVVWEMAGDKRLKRSVVQASFERA